MPVSQSQKGEVKTYFSSPGLNAAIMEAFNEQYKCSHVVIKGVNSNAKRRKLFICYRYYFSQTLPFQVCSSGC